MGNCCLSSKETELLESAEFNETEEQTYDFTRMKVFKGKIYDGDTFWAAAVHNNKLMKFNCRIYGLDTPEIKGSNPEEKKKAKEAKEFLASLIEDKIVNCEVLNNRTIEGKKTKEKYGRLLVNVKLPSGSDLAAVMIQGGYGVEYFGGTKQKW